MMYSTKNNLKDKYCRKGFKFPPIITPLTYIDILDNRIGYGK